MAHLELFESDPKPGQRQIRVDGEVDLAVANQLQAAIDRARDHALVLVDLSSCSFLDTMAIMVFIRASTDPHLHGRRLALFGPNRQVRWMLEMAGLAERGLIFDSAAEAEHG